MRFAGKKLTSTNCAVISLTLVRGSLTRFYTIISIAAIFRIYINYTEIFAENFAALVIAIVRIDL